MKNAAVTWAEFPLLTSLQLTHPESEVYPCPNPCTFKLLFLPVQLRLTLLYTLFEGSHGKGWVQGWAHDINY